MFFIINEEKKIIFGWSAKCGCSHVKKIIHYLKNGQIDNKIHDPKTEVNILPDNLDSYEIILFIRNPYKRLISGFIDKYNKNGQCNYLWNIDLKLTFSNFVDKLIENSNVIDVHHFTPQTNEDFNKNIQYHKNLIIYDIEKINYSYLEMKFNKKIPKELIEFRGGHERPITKIIKKPVYDLLIEEYYNYTPIARSYYNNKIINKVNKYYKNDFIFLKEKGFIYTII
jgi:hypothetical protein